MSEFVFPKPKCEFDYVKHTVKLLEDYVTPECAIPKGFVSDGASTGRLLQTLYPSFYTYLPAALVHDYMYRTGVRTKADADMLFKYNIEVRLKMRWVYYGPMYWGVRFFGGDHYKGQKK